MADEDALYLPEGDAFVATPHTVGGWYPDMQSGGAVLALLGHHLDDIATLVPMSLTRLTVDLVRPAPIGEPIHIEHEIVREGKKIQVVELTVRTEDAVHTRARALRVRDTDLSDGPLPSSTTDDADLRAAVPGPDELPSMDAATTDAAFLVTGVDFRRPAPGSTTRPCAWLRLRIPVVAGEVVRPTSRVTLPMDCVNLIGINELPGGSTAINPDVSAHVMRPPRSEWVGIAGDTRIAGSVGHGFSMGTLLDADGVFGVTSTSQIVQRPSSTS